MTTSVVIPNWRGRELLEKNLQSVLACGFDEVIVVDDASPDESREYLRENFPQVKIVTHRANRGFVESVNDGVKAASGEIVFLFNLDVKPPKDIIRRTVDHFKDPSIFGVSLHEKGYGWAKPVLKDGYILHKPGFENIKTHETFWVSGGSSAIRKSVWDSLGGFDRMLSPFYWEDVDLSIRAWRRGYTLLWESRAKVLHNHESTINKKHFDQRWLNRIKERNHLLVSWKHISLPDFLLFHLPGLLKRLVRPGYWIVLGMAFLQLPQILKGRIIESQEAKLSLREVVGKFET